MLSTRIITAVILLAAVAGALFALPPSGFTLVAAAALLGIGGWEAGRLAGVRAWPGFAAWLLCLLLLGGGGIVLIHSEPAAGVLFAASTLAWLAAPAWLMHPERGRTAAPGPQAPKLAAGALVLVPAFVAAAWLQRLDPWLVVFVILVIGAADIGAYFTGRTIGGPRLAPAISPGKTRSGAIGGLAAGTGIAAIAAGVLPGIPLAPLIAAGAGLLLAAMSIVGDLFISLLKRHRGMKDASALLPGHGGLLDRADSLCAALPAFALMVWCARLADGPLQ